ncbi:MAG: MFS transporter [Caldilinea sp. CFX5]|nr:MFS transporter [Caldilinea sp. CFX5]
MKEIDMATQVQRSSRLINAIPFFYGWVILAVGTWGSVMMGPSQTFTFGLFIDSFERELQLSRATLSLLYGMATLGAAFLLPLVGKAIDRYGARRMMLAVTLGFGLSCLAMGSAQGLVTLLLALLALRFLGFGAMHLTSTTLITQWFIRKRGFVMGLAGQSLAISLFIYPPLGEFLIDQFAWRGAWMAFGLLVWIIMLPLGWLFYRDKPELYGLHPDGDAPTAHGFVQTPQRGEQDNEVNWTLPEARQTRAFWIFAAALSATAMITAGLVFHQTSLFVEGGLRRDAAVSIFQVVAFASIAGNLIMGRLLDRFSARFLLAALMLLLAFTLLLVQVMHVTWHGVLYGICMGLCSGSFRVIDAVLWAKYFGRQHLGSIRGVTTLGATGGTALGAFPLGLSKDFLGSYVPALDLFIVITLLMACIVWFTKRPQKQ